MSYLVPLPSELKQVEYVQLYFHLQVKDTFDLPPLALLQLRRELLPALRTLEGWGGGDDVAQLKELFQPPLSQDPLVRRQAQKPAPAFVLAPDPQTDGLLKTKQKIVLPVFFLGRGVQTINAFVPLLQQLGQQGIYAGRGQFCLEGVESEDASGVRAMLWCDGKQAQLSPPVGDLHWLLERQRSDADQISLDVISPLRLLQNKKPLFKAKFDDLFPFVLRRVSSMLTSHAGVEVVNDPQQLHELASQVVVTENSLQWHDWRRLVGTDRGQDLGGLLGRMTLEGKALAELYWVLQLGSLFNVGKGAAYGAGQYHLRTCC